MQKHGVEIIFALMLTFNVLFAEEQLPVGSHPQAITFDYFPNRVYALVWRNWNLVRPERIAKTIGADVQDIQAIAASMGLPKAHPLPADDKKRIYITVLRRNWHLLPYNQLLTLLDMSADELEFSLKEDDFLFVKFGRLKPQCSPLHYRPPDEKERAWAQEIKQLVENFYKETPTPEPRFSCVKHLFSLDEVNAPAFTPSAGGPRFIYSYYGVFGDPLIDARLDPYPDGLLARLAAHGVNGIWLHVVLNQLAPGGDDFPEFGAQHEVRLANLRRLVERAKKYGIRVYLYMNEPRAMPASFFENRADMAGVRENDFIALCTSNDAVRRWLGNSLTFVFRQVPDLGGVFTITASENLTNCASHGRWQECPRCRTRNYADIIADVNRVIADGVHRGNPRAKVIVWDWGWHGHGDAPDVIAKLPKSAWLMSVSEWAKPIERGGVKTEIGEYSISAVGPGPRAQRHWALAKEAGLKTIAKVQFNNTWELSAVPFLPVLDLVAQHAANLAQADVDGVMLSWSLGGYPSPNLEIAQRFAQQPDADIDKVLNDLAERRYGQKAAPFARKAWAAFSKAFQQFPYSGAVLYRGPQQYGPGNPLFARPTGYASTMLGFPYDDLDGWRGPYSREIFYKQFDKVAAGWKKGLDSFEKVVCHADAEKRSTARADQRIAQAAWLHFASVANQARFIDGRDALLTQDLGEAGRRAITKRMLSLLKEEARIAEELFYIVQRDSRIGFEASNQYYYFPQDLLEKVINCDFISKYFEPRL